jgi:hypothetical protein
MSGVLAGIGFAAAARLDPGQGLLALLACSAGASGITSPDVDLWLKGKGMWAHRRITHWPPAVMMFAASAILLTMVNALAALPLVAAHSVGLLTHLAGDWAFGRRVYGTDGAGIPTTSPTSGYSGLGWFSSGGWAEKMLTWIVLAPVTFSAFAAWSGLPAPSVAMLLGVIVIFGSKTSRPRKKG